VSNFQLPSMNTKEEVKSAYLKLSSEPIAWQRFDHNIIGMINAAVIFRITLNDSLRIEVETFYPGRENILGLGLIESIESAQTTAEGFYHNWLKEDFRNLLDSMGE